MCRPTKSQLSRHAEPIIASRPVAKSRVSNSDQANLAIAKLEEGSSITRRPASEDENSQNISFKDILKEIYTKKCIPGKPQTALTNPGSRVRQRPPPNLESQHGVLRKSVKRSTKPESDSLKPMQKERMRRNMKIINLPRTVFDFKLTQMRKIPSQVPFGLNC